ncbi:NAD-dependent epimerase/dehydratase family protein [Streptomyces sp. RKAG290]|uniref:NAD-dependent epimerase/dehydratase family protein n=1 Tax=Streptomyces sp. RKAG290 TaxID=2888348 RepID=UPI0035A927D2
MTQSEHRAAPEPPPVTPPCIVVLGGTGFLGRHVRTAFRSAGAEVVSVSRPGLAGPGRDDLTGDRQVALDLLAVRPDELAETLAALDPDTVVNASGRSGTSPSGTCDWPTPSWSPPWWTPCGSCRAAPG